MEKECPPNHPYAPLILAIQNLHSRQWVCKITHVMREENRVADFLATFGHSLEVGLHCLRSPLTGCGSLLSHDSIGVTFPRLVAS